jgi:hypothetical protein
VGRVGDLVWLPKARRFAALFNRFKWENRRGGDNLRVRSGLYFNSVLSAKSHNILRGDPDGVLSLLAIRFAQKGAEDPGGTVELIFSGGGSIQLEVEALDVGLSDVSGEWAALGRPDHETDS